MGPSFDPYHKWLGIPAEEQPPNLYRLLGIKPFEADPDVIQTAADQRMLHLRSYQTGKHADTSQRLLNEVATANVCLLNPAKKAVYDRQLAAESQRPLPTAQLLDEPETAVAVPPSEVAALQQAPYRPTVGKVAQGRVRKKSQWPGIAIGAGIVGALLIAGLIFSQLAWQDDTAVAQRPAAKHSEPSHDDPPVAVKKADVANRDVPHAKPAPATPVIDKPPAKVTEKPIAPKTPATLSLQPEPAGSPEPKEETASPPVAPVPSNPPPEEKPQEQLKPPQSPSVPSEDEQEEAVKLVDELYKDEYAKAKTPEEKKALAKKMIDQAARPSSNAAGTYVLLERARDLAVEGADREMAFQIIDTLAGKFTIDALGMKTKVLSNLGKKAQTPPQHLAIAEQAARLMEEATTENKLPQAAELGKLAVAEAGKARDKDFVVRVRARGLELQKTLKLQAEFEAAQTTLADSPDDPDANLTAGVYLCFVQGDWEKGLKYLGKSSDDDLKSLAQQELDKPPNDAAARVKLADAWWDLGQAAKNGSRKDALLLHAGTWYDRAQRGLDGLNKIKVEKRLQEIAQIERQRRLNSQPKIPFNKWFPLLTSANELTAWEGVDSTCRYANRIIEIRSHDIYYPIVAKDMSIRAKVTKYSGGELRLMVRNSARGCYAAQYRYGDFSISRLSQSGVRAGGVGGVGGGYGSGMEPYVLKRVYAGYRMENVVFEFAVAAVGQTLTVFVNRQPVLQVQDASFTEGTAGLGTVYGAGLFTDVEMLIPNAASLVSDNRDAAAAKAKAAPTPANDQPPPAKMPVGAPPKSKRGKK
jgi:hypothetical protein